MGVLDAFTSLSKNINKWRGDQYKETEQGIISDKFPELTLKMKNEDLIALCSQREKKWSESAVKSEWLKRSEENAAYWKGEHFNRPEIDKNRSIVDNAIFEALETYLPQTTRRNPEPVVALVESAEEDEAKENYAKDLQKKLGELADELKLRLKLKKVARNWAISLLGVAKMGWDMDKDIPTVRIIRAQKLILDPEATIDEDGYTGEFIGEYRKMEASRLIGTLENIGSEKGAVDCIKKLVGDKLGTEVQFIEWCTDQYLCWTLNKEVLVKMKNPNWNYDTETPGEETNDEYGQVIPAEPTEVLGFNHFPVPKKPYVFLSIFNLGLQPIDDTSLIGQNLSNQDRINKRVKQIDKNADSMNGGMVVSLERSGLTPSQAKGVTVALRNGGTVVIPSGSPAEAVQRMSAPGLPADVYNDLQDTRGRLKDIFGVRGSTPESISSETTVRGKIINRGLDTDRIGGGVTEYLEQFADDIYNWMIQLLYVHDDLYSQIKDKPKVTGSVKEGSLLPKDSTTIANQAIELAAAGKMSNLDLYKKLDYPNPEELGANAWLEINAPEVLYPNDPRIAQVMQQRSQAAQEPPKAPSESISFRDLMPDAQAQMLAKVGIQADPEAIAAYDEHVSQKEKDDAMLQQQATSPVQPMMQ